MAREKPVIGGVSAVLREKEIFVSIGSGNSASARSAGGGCLGGGGVVSSAVRQWVLQSSLIWAFVFLFVF